MHVSNELNKNYQVTVTMLEVPNSPRFRGTTADFNVPEITDTPTSNGRCMENHAKVRHTQCMSHGLHLISGMGPI